MWYLMARSAFSLYPSRTRKFSDTNFGIIITDQQNAILFHFFCHFFKISELSVAKMINLMINAKLVPLNFILYIRFSCKVKCGFCMRFRCANWKRIKLFEVGISVASEEAFAVLSTNSSSEINSDRWAIPWRRSHATVIFSTSFDSWLKKVSHFEESIKSVIWSS